MSHPAVQILVVALSVAGLLGAMAAIKRAGAAYGWGPEAQRKGVHVATGLYALSLPFLFVERWPVVLLVAAAIATMLVLRLPAVARGGIGSTLHGVRRKSWGDVLLALAVGFLFLRSEGAAILYVLPLLMVTLSDAAAALAGSAYGRRIFTVEDGSKSVEGVAVFFLTGWIVAMTSLLLLTDAPRVSVVVISFAIAAFGALVEADSWRGLDNLFVPVGVHLFLETHLDTPPLELGVVAAAFLASLAALVGLAPSLRISAHAARAYAVAIFLIASVSGFFAAATPILALLAHLVARAARPCRGRWPDLDALATTAAVALLWLALGEAVGPSAINYFVLTFAGAALVYATLAASGLGAGARALVALGAGLALLAAHAGLVTLSSEAQRWHGDVLPVAAGALAVCALTAGLRPGWFDRWRAPRAAALAALVPLAAYLTEALT